MTSQSAAEAEATSELSADDDRETDTADDDRDQGIEVVMTAVTSLSNCLSITRQ